jgi:aminoglycoside phosphotransferase (APT) family kinase protein
MRQISGLPHDSGLPALVAILAVGLAAAVPGLGLDDDDIVGIDLLAHKPDSRATLGVLTRDGRRMVLKASAQDPSQEAALHQALAAAGLCGDSGDRAPPLRLWDRDLCLLVFGWLEGKTAHQLLREGQGARAAALAAGWLRRVAPLPIRLGKTIGPGRVLSRAEKWVAALGAADAGLGRAAASVTAILRRAEPRHGAPRLVHGSFHDRNVLDAGDGAGVIDWTRFKQGPTEFDAGMFLAAISRVQVDEPRSEAITSTEQTFLEGIAGLVDERALRWYRGYGLLTLADRALTHKKPGWLPRAHALLDEAARFAAAAV